MSPLIWVLADTAPGHFNQSIGVAEKMGMPFETIKLKYNNFARLPNVLLGSSLIGIASATRMHIHRPWPDLVISAGRRTAPVALYIKKKNPSAFLCHLMDPGHNRDKFDMLVVPEHDKLPDAPNVIRTLTTPHRLSLEMLSVARSNWAKEFESLPSPRVALIVGGKTKAGHLRLNEAAELGLKVAELTHKAGGSVMVTTSRRTGAKASAYIKKAVGEAAYFYYPSMDTENPYLGYLAWADYIVVTGDSPSMISEACFTGKPVFIADRLSNLTDKHSSFCRKLYNPRVAMGLGDEFVDFEYEAPDTAREIAEQLKVIMRR